MTAAPVPAAFRRGATIRLAGITAGYVVGQPTLEGLSLTGAPGKITVVLGPNGSGKSTSLKVMAGLLRPWQGWVELARDGQTLDLTGSPSHDRARHKVAYLPQGHSVFPTMTVHDNLVLGAWPLKRDRRAAAAAVDAAYERYPQLREKRRAAAGSPSRGRPRPLAGDRLLVGGAGEVGEPPPELERHRRGRGRGREVVAPGLAQRDGADELRCGMDRERALGFAPVGRAGTEPVRDLARPGRQLPRQLVGIAAERSAG